MCALVGSILKDLDDPVFRVRPRDHSREGVLSRELLVTLLLFMTGDGNRRGYGHLLERFWAQCQLQGIVLPTADPVSASAFCQARAKISPELLRAMLARMAAEFERAFPKACRWHGLRVFAVDGSKFDLQRGDELQRVFGRPENGYSPQATVSTLVNVCSGVALEARIAPFASCERKLLLQHLDTLKPGDVLILDRGYPSHEVLHELMKRKLDFLIRVPNSHTFESFDWLRQTGRNDYRLVLNPPAGAAASAREPLELRGIQLTQPSGEKSYFVTSLRRSDFTRHQLAELYHLRWRIEESYKTAKSSYLQQRQFHARTAQGVRQEIVAQFLFMAIARFLTAAAARRHRAKFLDLSVKASILNLADSLTILLLAGAAAISQLTPRLLTAVARNRDRRRRGRSCPRRSFKPGPKWGPSGRRGA